MNRRRALQTLYRWSITTLLVNAGSGAIAGGRDGDESSEWADEYFKAARPIYEKATSIRGVKLSKVYGGKADLTVEKLSPLPGGKELSKEHQRYLIGKLLDISSYNFEGRQATLFYANYGFIFEGDGVSPNILLISTGFKGARLVLEKPLHPRIAIVNLERMFPELESLLTSELT
jgi:hypothetical protein